MTQSELKELKAIGAELGAAKAEVERLKSLMRQAIPCLAMSTNSHAASYVRQFESALSQQAEPECRCSMRERLVGDGCSICNPELAAELEDDEPAPAQDERKTFEVEIPDISAIYDGRSFIPYRSLEAGERLMTVAQHLRIEKQLRAALTRPAQTEQQPKEEIPKPDGWVAAGRFFTDRDEAIAAAEKTPCVDVYFRPSLLTVLARSAERQSVAEELARLLSQSNRDIRQLNAAPIAQTATQGKFRMGDLVKKSSGSEWEGRVVGYYRTEQTQEGYAVESSAHRNSVQIYPAKALEAVE